MQKKKKKKKMKMQTIRKEKKKNRDGPLYLKEGTRVGSPLDCGDLPPGAAERRPEEKKRKKRTRALDFWCWRPLARGCGRARGQAAWPGGFVFGGGGGPLGSWEEGCFGQTKVQKCGAERQAEETITEKKEKKRGITLYDGARQQHNSHASRV